MSKKKDVEQYPQDEFDNPPQGSPVGLHRGSRPVGARVLPYILTVVIAVVLALVLWLWLSGTVQNMFANRSSSTASSSQQANSTSQSGTDDTSGTDNSGADSTDSTADGNTTDNSGADDTATGGDTSDAQTQTPTPASPDTSTKVTVYNATGKSGYAAAQAKILTDAGYTTVSAANASNGLPQVNTVYYKDSADMATAQDVASKLGISSVSQSSSISVPIAAIYVE